MQRYFSFSPHFRAAFRQVLPVLLGYLPVAFAYGVLAQKSGLSALNSVFMSLMVYAGSAQLIAVGLFATGVAPLSIVLTTFIVNLRHLLMSAAMSPYLKGWSQGAQAFFAAELTDETFALHISRFTANERGQLETLIMNMLAHGVWVGGSVLGVAASTLITDIRPIGLDYALPAMFVVLLFGQLKSWLHGIVALLAGILGVLFAYGGMTHGAVMLATLVAATSGLVLYIWTNKLSSS